MVQAEEGNQAITGRGSRVNRGNVSSIFCLQKADKSCPYINAMFYKESLCPPLHYRTKLCCNLSPINVVGLIVSVDLDRGYQMVARYCGCVTCHVSRGVMTRASTVPGRGVLAAC